MTKATLLNMCMITDPNTGRVVVQDKRGSRWDGLTFPGGHVEPGESLAASVRREIWEETGLHIKDSRLCGVVHWCDQETEERRIIFLYRSCEFTGNLIEETREGPVFWMDLPEMVKSPRLSDGILDYLQVFLQEDKSEAFARRCQKGNWDGFEIL